MLKFATKVFFTCRSISGLGFIFYLLIGFVILICTDGNSVYGKTCNSSKIKNQIEQLDKNPISRNSAVEVLSNCGDSAVPALLQKFKKNQSKFSKESVILVLNKIGTAAIPDLIQFVDDKTIREEDRENILFTLSQITQDDKAQSNIGIKVLVDLLEDKSDVISIRNTATFLLGEYFYSETQFIPNLIAIFSNPNENDEVRYWTAVTLAKVNPKNLETNSTVLEIIQAKQESKILRKRLVSLLGRTSISERELIKALTPILHESQLKRTSEGWLLLEEALNVIESSLIKLQRQSYETQSKDLYQIQTDIENILKVIQNKFTEELQEPTPKLEWSSQKLSRLLFIQSKSASIQQILQNLNTKPEASQKQDIPSITKRVFFDKIFIFLVSFIGSYLVYRLILWKKPLLLLKLPSTSFNVPKIGNFAGFSIPYPILAFLKYHPRVLNAWVEEKIDKVRQNFEILPTVEYRQFHVPIPVSIQKMPPIKLEAKSELLQSSVKSNRVRWLILGEGGSGKTSLACQIAKWAMEDNEVHRLCDHLVIPLLIENVESSLMKEIQTKLKELRDDNNDLSEEVIKQLLKKKRIMVIIDHLSEMSQELRKAILEEAESLSVNFLVITSRFRDVLGKQRLYTLLEPQRISKGQSSMFLDYYLIAKNMRQLFDDKRDYVPAVIKLDQIMGIQEDITVLFAKLYIELVIDAKIKGKSIDKISNNIPTIIRDYLNTLNENVDGERLDNESIYKILRLIAWECLHKTFKPVNADYEKILNIISEANPNFDNSLEIAKQYINYLEKRLSLIQLFTAARTQLSFQLDPIAEYLACLHLRELYGSNIQSWQDILTLADEKKQNHEEIQSFLLALKDCCSFELDGLENVPSFVTDELAKLAGLNLEAIKRERFNRLIESYISSLDKHNPNGIRLAAIEKLSEIGVEASDAVPDLVELLRDKSQEISSSACSALVSIGKAAVPELIKTLEDKVKVVRISAIQTLGEIGLESSKAVPTLLVGLKNDDIEVKRAVIVALGQITYCASSSDISLAELVEKQEEPIEIRKLAAQSLGKMNSISEIALNHLKKVAENECEAAQVRLSAAQALYFQNQNVQPFVTELSENEILLHPLNSSITVFLEELGSTVHPLEMVLISDGSFIMGSPLTESGHNESEKQYQVPVNEFFMSKYPVTQAQWRAVASLPKVSREISLEPSKFRGETRPVESISWLDAVEFCSRISNHTGKEYWLPNEAEWEYSCRARTTTPFHFGENISKNLACYDRYVKGVSEEQQDGTTPVGSFCIVNSFGLSDMHGNVWEFCANSWHDDYQDSLNDDDKPSKVIRGGSWTSPATQCRSATRNLIDSGKSSPSIGFRVCCSIGNESATALGD